MSDPIIVPIEIRPGVYARIQIPPDLTRMEAEKISRVALSYGGAVKPIRKNPFENPAFKTQTHRSKATNERHHREDAGSGD